MEITKLYYFQTKNEFIESSSRIYETPHPYNNENVPSIFLIKKIYYFNKY